MVNSPKRLRPEFIVCLFLVILTLAAYAEISSHTFVGFDDNDYIVENNYVQEGITRESIIWAFTTTEFYWHPLTWLSHMLDFELFGLRPGLHHLFSRHRHQLSQSNKFDYHLQHLQR